MASDGPRSGQEEPEDGVPSGGIEIVDLVPLPPPSPRLIRIESWQLPEKLELKPGESVTWELDVDPGVTVGIAFRSSPFVERGRLGPFSSLELGGAPLENGKHRVRITGFSAWGHEAFGGTFDYTLGVVAQEAGESLQAVELPSATGQLMVDKSGDPPGAGPDWPPGLGNDKKEPWQRVFLKTAPPPAAVPQPPSEG
jgi:hypothetical protein